VHLRDQVGVVDVSGKNFHRWRHHGPQNLPRERSREGRFSRQVVHHPVRTVSAKLGRQPLLLHLAGERLVVVVHGDELDGKIRARGQHRVPDVARAVVFRAADDADVDGMRAIAERAVPLDPRVGAEKDIRLALAQEALEQSRGRRRLPQETR